MSDWVTTVVAVRGAAVRLRSTPFRAEGGGQASDVGVLALDDGREVRVVDVQLDEDELWHELDRPVELGAVVRASVDEAHRLVLGRLHTAAHLLNALVFTRYEGALVNGARLRGDGVGRVDFDLPDVASGDLRALEPAVADLIRADLPVREAAASLDEVLATPGLVRSLGRIPPTSPDGTVRVVEVEGFDRQACGGTHVARTGLIGTFAITNVDNKGRHHKRVVFTVDLPQPNVPGRRKGAVPEPLDAD
jgi:misacylated tRNA(Ala) deacylase